MNEEDRREERLAIARSRYSLSKSEYTERWRVFYHEPFSTTAQGELVSQHLTRAEAIAAREEYATEDSLIFTDTTKETT